MKLILKSAIAVSLLGILIFTQFTSCKKTTSNTMYPISGLWIGTYATPTVQSQGSLFYSFTIFPDGTMITKGMTGNGTYSYSTGTWTLSSTNIFTGNIVSIVSPAGTNIAQTITANFSNSGTLTNGVWSNNSSSSCTGCSGSFSTMQRVN